MLMVVGSIGFETGQYAPSAIERESQFRWPEQSIAGGRPQRQYLGPGDDSVRIRGTLVPAYDPTRKNWPEETRIEAEKGKPLIIIDGRGNVWPDKWVITAYQTVETHSLNNGAPRKVVWSIDLERWGS